VWPVLETVSARIDSSPIVTRVLSPVDVLAKINQWQQGFDPAAYHPPESSQQAQKLIAGAGSEGRRALARLVAEDGRTVRLSALVNEMHEQRFLQLVAAARQAITEVPADWQVRLTGQVLLLVEAQQRLVSTQVRSLVLAFVMVFAVLAVGLRSLRLMLLAVPPNLLPVLAAFAAMVAFDLPLDAGTVMVASIALGIAVDNTVHVLANVRRRLEAGLAVDQSTVGTLRDIAPAMVATTATACVGFLALATSEFVPIRDFGLLATVAMAAALVADLVVLPAMLVVTRERS
jgi:predicted RND superfamily exporter protein